MGRIFRGVWNCWAGTMYGTRSTAAMVAGGDEPDDGLSLSQRIAEAAVAEESIDPSEDADGETEEA